MKKQLMENAHTPHRFGSWRAPLIAGAGLLVLIGIAGSRSRANGAPNPGPPSDLVARGEYLVTIGACNDCHTPFKLCDQGPEPDMKRMLSGHPGTLVVGPAVVRGEGWVWAGTGTNTAFSGPWGVSYSANLTPHDTGIAAWSEDIFIATLRTGKHWGQSRPILPPMPWQSYGRMTDEDLKAVFAYLRTIPPIDNTVPLPIPPGGEEGGDEAFN